jgi:hypothetical protein
VRRAVAFFRRGAFFRATALFFGCAFRLGRLAERRAGVRFRADLLGLGRRAAGRLAMGASPFGTLTV